MLPADIKESVKQWSRIRHYVQAIELQGNCGYWNMKQFNLICNLYNVILRIPEMS